MRGAGLGIPAFELAQIAPGGVLEHLQPILDRAGLAIVTLEIEIERATVGRIPDQRFEHADHLGALFIDGGGVEIVDLHIALRAHRMGQRAAVFAKLAGAQGFHVLDTLHVRPAPVGGIGLIAENRQPLFQAQLEPVAQGDAVAGPVVEIFMGDDAFDPGEILVRFALRIGQHGGRVEDVEPLVFHRPHVEIRDRDDVENVQIVFAPVGGLVPGHGAFQGLHRKAAFVQIVAPDPDRKRHIAPRHGAEFIPVGHQIAGHQREQVAGLGPGVVPLGDLVLARAGVAV